MSEGRLWEWPVRLCHWALAGLVAVNLIEDSGDYSRRLLGYIAVGVVLVRLMWGAISRSNGRLSGLRPSVCETLLYSRQLWQGTVVRYAGHNPLAIWMIWSLVLLLGVTGWMSRLDAFWGDDDVHFLHELLANLLLTCVCLHLVAVAVTSVLLKENLLSAMLFRRERAN